MDITHSNFPPSAEEEQFLRALLKQKNEELITISENVAKTKNELASSEEAIKELKESSRLTRKALDMYKDHQKHLIASQKILNNRLTITKNPSSLNAPKLKLSSDLHKLVAPDLESRRITVDAEVESLEEMCANLKALSFEIDEDIRCQQYAQNINTESLGVYSATYTVISTAIEKLTGAFRAIKRIPDEIWMQILGIVVNQQNSRWRQRAGKPLWLPPLTLTHVCRAWRRVVAGSPALWTTIHSRISPGNHPNRDLLKLWARYCEGSVPHVINDQSYGELPSAAIDVQAVLRAPKLLNYEIRQAQEVPPNTPEDYSSASFPALVTICVISVKRAPKVQEQLLKRFSNIKGLLLSNVLPHRGLTHSNSLIYLSVQLSIPHGSYSLRRYLSPSLQILDLRHYDIDGVPVLDEPVELPNLCTLTVTPLEHKIAGMLQLPKLSTLKLLPPVKSKIFPDQWLDSFIPLCATATELQFSQWKHASVSFDVLQAFTKLYPQTPKLKIVKFEYVDLDGSALADLLGNQDKAQLPTGQRIEEFIIDGCIGVSRWDCDRLVRLVDKLKVFDTVHGETRA